MTDLTKIATPFGLLDKETQEALKAAANAGEPTCTKCGHERSKHPYRHLFMPSHTTTLESLSGDMARALLAAEALADATQALRSAQFAYLANRGVELGNAVGEAAKKLDDALTAYRKAMEVAQ